jgi:hypothetical protein
VKASVVTAYGGPEVMKYQDMPDPTLGAGQVLIEVAGIGINPEDMLERNGDLKDRWQLQFPAIIGLDVSGTVIATGDGVTDLAVGERVCAWSYHTYAELLADEATLFAKIPDTMDLVDAAAIPLVGITGSHRGRAPLFVGCHSSIFVPSGSRIQRELAVRFGVVTLEDRDALCLQTSEKRVEVIHGEVEHEVALRGREIASPLPGRRSKPRRADARSRRSGMLRRPTTPAKCPIRPDTKPPGPWGSC